MQGKIVAITGASSGIGLETARALAAMGARIVMIVRSRDRGEAAIANIKAGGDGVGAVAGAQIDLVLADLYSLAEVRKAGAELRERFPRIDVLVNNAGLIHAHRELTVDGIEKTFALNHLAAFLLTYELRETIASRVITVASSGHHFARFDWDDIAKMDRWRNATVTYGVSKLCNIWFAREAARRFKARGVTSNSLHPGPVATNFGQSGSWVYRLGTKLVRPFLKTAAQGARTSIYLASSPAVEGVTGEYFVGERIAQPSKRAREDAPAKKLWELSEQLCGVSWP